MDQAKEAKSKNKALIKELEAEEAENAIQEKRLELAEAAIVRSKEIIKIMKEDKDEEKDDGEKKDKKKKKKSKGE